MSLALILKLRCTIADSAGYEQMLLHLAETLQ
jgi:hypothetical protein